MQRFFAIAYKDWGYVLDYYPNERASYLKVEGKNIVGDFPTREEAAQAVERSLEARRN